MQNHNRVNPRNQFLYPISNCHTQVCEQDRDFHEHLQRFAHQVNYIAGLHENGKISTRYAYEQLSQSWQLLKPRNI